MESISSYIIDKCNLNKAIFAIGKYNTIENKIKLYDEEYMKQYLQENLQEKSLLCEYFEFCTEPQEEFDEKIENFLHSLIGEFNNNNKLKNNELIMKQEETNPTNQEKESNATSSKGGCILQ